MSVVLTKHFNVHSNMLTQSEVWTLRTVWPGDRAKVQLQFSEKNCCMCTQWYLQHKVIWQVEFTGCQLTCSISLNLTHCTSAQKTCKHIHCPWSTYVCQQTDLKLCLTSVDVVGGLVEFLQLPLKDREHQRDETKTKITKIIFIVDQCPLATVTYPKCLVLFHRTSKNTKTQQYPLYQNNDKEKQQILSFLCWNHVWALFNSMTKTNHQASEELITYNGDDYWFAVSG